MSMAKQIASLLALGTVGSFLQGCNVGTESQNCNGDACSCSLTFHSFWARIRISGVHIEDAHRTFNIPDVAKDVPNATSAPCCDAIYDQIDYDEGKADSMPARTVDSFAKSCPSSPNKEVAAAANHSDAQPAKLAWRLHGSRRLTRNDAPQYQPIDDGQVGQDCNLYTHNFNLSETPITGGTMSVGFRWVDPKNAPTDCCDALTPVVEHVIFEGKPESTLRQDVRDKFCSACKKSNNQGIALAAYRCFGTSDEGDVSV